MSVGKKARAFFLISFKQRIHSSKNILICISFLLIFPVFSQITSRDISFDDITPSGYSLKQCWDHIGMDNEERIYVGFTAGSPEGVEDVVLFRYDPSDDSREFLGTFIQTSKAVNNYENGEAMPKGHTHIVNVNGTMYMGEQGFHDFKGSIDALSSYRGAHIFTFDSHNDILADATKDLPNGVIVEHEGIITLSYTTWQNQIACVTHPHSDIILLDVNTHQITRTIEGIPWSNGNPLSREIILTPAGKIYTYRGTERPGDANSSYNIYSCDLTSGANSVEPINFECTKGFWDGQVQTRDGKHVYVSTIQGNLYHLDVENDSWELLGYLLPQDEYNQGARYEYLFGIGMSPDEKNIIIVPSFVSGPASSGDVYAYNIENDKVIKIAEVGHGYDQCYCGCNVRDSRGNVYFVRFGTSGDGFKGNCRLLQIDLGVPAVSATKQSVVISNPKLNLDKQTRSFTVSGRLLPSRSPDLATQYKILDIKKPSVKK